MFENLLTLQGQTRRLVIEHAEAGGWDVQEELDSRVLSRARVSDWHRVERLVRMRVALLERDGWHRELPAYRVSTNR